MVGVGPQEVVVCPGLALYQATAGYISPALMRTEIEMRAAGHGVEPQFQLPVPVDEFMQRSHQLSNSLTGTISQVSIFVQPKKEEENLREFLCSAVCVVGEVVTMPCHAPPSLGNSHMGKIKFRQKEKGEKGIYVPEVLGSMKCSYRIQVVC